MKEQFLYKQGDLVTVPTTIAILGGNSVAGRALEALLQGVGYDTRLIEDPPERSPEQLLEGVRLLLLAPTLSTESRETLLTEMGSMLEAANIPVLTLSTTLKEALGDGPVFIPWPCRLEDLTKKIEAALLRVPEVGRAQAPVGP
ncbi:MAG TPA: hypothetical protein VI055_06945 [Rubrobacter sp.]|jgi:hypothetical protein